ncbi:MAG: leucine-rich repeat protein [Clostridia bacterium]|nr:leucine-rich repeat protein [Clostridia bacterium]
MSKRKIVSLIKGTIVVIIAAVMLIGCFASAPANSSAPKYGAAFIERLEGVGSDYTDHLNGNVVYRLPEGVSEDVELSVIVTVDTKDIMSVYENTDKSVSLGQFAAGSAEAAEIIEEIQGKKAEVLFALDKAGVEYSTGEDYSTLISGFEVLVAAKDYPRLCSVLDKGYRAIVGEVYEVCDTTVVENEVNVFGTGIFDSSAAGYDGSGMVVAVLDTGLDSKHSAFSTDNFSSDKLGLTYDEVAALIDKTTASKLFEGLSVDDVYVNEKVPFGFDYADSDPDMYSTHNEHGTHVSGVITGKDDTITGVAPNAQLVAMKIFSDVMDTARSSWILSALEDCVILGVDVINMSLGTACGFSRESDEEALNGVYDKIRAAGISVIAAASNSYSSAYGSEANGNLGLTSNPDTGTVGSPSTYEGVMSVASIKGTETPYLKFGDTIIYFDESNNGANEPNDFFATLLGDRETLTIEYVTVPGIGRSADYSGLDVKGKIALVRRGDNTFEEKSFIAQAQGATGIIIYNNVSGDIKMNVGDAELATCSISQNDGEMLAAAKTGTLVLAVSQKAGPFIDDFSSWGPTPSLGIKPEITAHGGNILSAVTGGGYDRLSGTSMACPNLAGVVILLRQYVVESFPEIANDNVKVSALVNRLLMSTADIALNTNGLPYAVRKQGAGLANLLSSLKTPAYITTFDKDGKEMDKTKLELGDDPEKKGVYEMSFTVNNIGDGSLSYDIGAFVFTEGVGETKTNSGKTTVSEEAYILEGAELAIGNISGGTLNGTKLTVGAGKSASVTLTVTLSDRDKAYLDSSFENGMYVEGFITLTAVEGTDIDLNVPYLAFYGDWTVAPLFDLDYYATNADELDDAIAIEDKTMADAYATRPIGGIYDDYVSFLGSYYFKQNPEDIVIAASRDYIALSNQEGAIHSLRFVWAGLLRNAERIVVTITDDTTGEVVFETVDDDVRKSYGDGGTPYPSNVEIEFDTADYNLKNNTRYTVRLTGYMDYGDGALETNKNNVFEFPLTVDFEAPTVTDTEFYYEYDNTAKKNRLYAKVAVYDNHYAMSAQLGYVINETDADGNTAPQLKTFGNYLTPVYASKANTTTYVTFDLTDYIYKIKESAVNRNTFVLTCYDYALNYASFEIGLPDEYVDFYFEGLEGGLTMSPNEVYTLEPATYPDSAWTELLSYDSSSVKTVRVVNNKLVAVAPGMATIRARDPESGKSVTFKVKVLAEGDEGFVRYDKPVADVFMLDGYKTLKAYYMVDNDDKELGDTGDERFFGKDFSLTMYPSESVALNYTLNAYFPNDTTVSFEAGNSSIVTVNESGVVTAVAEGFSSVTVKVLLDGQSTFYSQTVNVEVKDPYVTNGGQLTHYYGNGGLVSVPADLSLKEIGPFAFSNFEYIMKTPEELEIDDRETSKMWFIGDSTITKVILPEGVKKISNYAFASLTALEEIVLPSTLESIEYGAFYGCTSLKKISFSGENNLKIINQNAFENCDLEGDLDLSAVCIVSDYAFAGNKDLKTVQLSDTLLSVGRYAFAGCKSLEKVTIDADKVKYGSYAFTDCEALTEFYVNAAVIPDGMFYECRSLETVTVGKDVNDIGEFAFRDTKVSRFVISEGNSAYKVKEADHILSADGKMLIAVAATLRGDFGYDSIGGTRVTAVGVGAFSHNTKLSSVVLPEVTVIGDYGFASCDGLSSVTLGKLTEIGEYAFFETPITELPAFTKDTEIGRYAFANTAITSVNVPDGTVVKEGVFSENFKLESITVGDGVTLGKYAFQVSKDYAFRVTSYFDELGRKLFYYEFGTALSSLTIGKDCVIGDNAFANAASLEAVTLGNGARIGYMAFYNNASLKEIDLSKALEIGDYAFSGDVYYVCYDENMNNAAADEDGHYIYTYHSPLFESIDISSSASVGENAFSYCRSLKEIVLGDKITEIPDYAFAGCIALESADLKGIVTVGNNAFAETDIAYLDLSSATSIGDYAFVYDHSLEQLELNHEGCEIGEGAFSYCEKLTGVKGLEHAKSLGDYAFAYSGLTEADLSGAESLGDHVFMKESLTPFTVVLGEALGSVGDNPFAMCDIAPFSKIESTEFNGQTFETALYTFDISDSVKVIDGSLYCRTATGLELCVYAAEGENAKVAEDTVRIASFAFAGADLIVAELPSTVRAIGHKAFFDCKSLGTVVFTSYEAPILEEEFDPTYYECFEHIPGTGEFGNYTDYHGNEVPIIGMGLLPYYMWNTTDGLYFNVFYGASFIDYVGYVEDKLTMVKPVNGQCYDTFIMEQYFDMSIEGAAAADDVTLVAIEAIKAIPKQVTYEDKAYVEAARAAYSRIATTVQQSLVINYADLVAAEQRITALTPTEGESSEDAEGENGAGGKSMSMLPVWISVGVIFAAAIGISLVTAISASKKKSADNSTEDGDGSDTDSADI